MSILEKAAFTTALDNLAALSYLGDKLTTTARKRKFIVVAGQSNTDYGRGFIDPLVLAEIPEAYRNLDPRLKMLIRDNLNHRLSLAPATWAPIDQDASNGGHGYAYLLGRHILSTMQSYEELIIVQVAKGGTGWSNNEWGAKDPLWLQMVDQVRYATQTLEAECIGVFWSQGETDAGANEQTIPQKEAFGAMYKHLLPNMAMALRQVIGHATGDWDAADKVPFVTFDMVAAWVAANSATAQRVQDVLTNIGTTIPYAANVNVTYSADLETDQVHYDSRQQMQIAKGMYLAWLQAKASTFTLPAMPSGETLIFRQVAPTVVPLSHKILFLEQNPNAADPLAVNIFSRIGEFWKYRNSRKNFKMRYQCFGVGSAPATGSIVVEQAYTPLSFTGHLMPAALISADLKVGDHNSNNTFGGLGYFNTALASGDALFAFSTNAPTPSWFAPVGQNAVFGNRIPIHNPTSGTYTESSEVRLYAVMD